MLNKITANKTRQKITSFLFQFAFSPSHARFWNWFTEIPRFFSFIPFFFNVNLHGNHQNCQPWISSPIENNFNHKNNRYRYLTEMLFLCFLSGIHAFKTIPDFIESLHWHTRVCIYIYIYIHTHTQIYIYIYIERERVR